MELFAGTRAHFDGGDVPISLHPEHAAYRFATGIKGSGTVFIYRKVQGGEYYPLRISLKIMSNDGEVRALDMLRRSGIIIPWRVLSVPERSFVYMAMPCFDGTLWDYLLRRGGDIDTSVILNIMITCLKECRNLWVRNMTYMDIKSTNVLYNACGSSIGIMFGDIGSINSTLDGGDEGEEDDFRGEIDENRAYISSTYPLPTDSRTYGVRQTVGGMLWSTAVMGMQLMALNVKMYEHETVRATNLPTRLLQDNLSKNALKMVRDCHDHWPAKKIDCIVRAFENLVYGSDFDTAIRGLEVAEALCDA